MEVKYHIAFARERIQKIEKTASTYQSQFKLGKLFVSWKVLDNISNGELLEILASHLKDDESNGSTFKSKHGVASIFRPDPEHAVIVNTLIGDEPVTEVGYAHF